MLQRHLPVKQSMLAQLRQLKPSLTFLLEMFPLIFSKLIPCRVEFLEMHEGSLAALQKVIAN